jgi:hypothetical protein
MQWEKNGDNMKRVWLNWLERKEAIRLLPDTGSYIELRTVKNLFELLNTTDQEVILFKPKQAVIDGVNVLQYPEEALEEKLFELTDDYINILKNSLIVLDGEKRLGVKQITLYEKIVLV